MISKVCIQCKIQKPLEDFEYRICTRKSKKRKRKCKKCMDKIRKEMNNYRVCRNCGEKKILSDFYPTTRGGRRSTCKLCEDTKIFTSNNQKVCNTCGESKYLSNFYSNGKGGLQGKCKECESERRKKRYQEKEKKATPERKAEVKRILRLSSDLRSSCGSLAMVAPGYTKICSDCKKLKLKDEFPINNNCTFKLQCKECFARRQRKRSKTPAARAARRRYNRKPEVRARRAEREKERRNQEYQHMLKVLFGDS